MGLFLPVVVSLIWLYILLRLILKLPCRPIGKFVFALILLFIANYHQFTGRFFGTLGAPELPWLVLVILAWAFGAFLVMALLTLLRDLLALLMYKPVPQAAKSISGSARLSVIILGLSVALSVFGVWQAVKVPDVKTIGLQLDDLPPSFNNYRIVQLSDPHATNLLPQSWQAAVVAKANALNPDLIVITGDLADGSVRLRAADVEPLRDLKAVDGVVAIPGNHEYYSDYISWMDKLRGLGLIVLENQHITIDRDQQQLVVAGLTDRQARSFALTPPDLSHALLNAPQAPLILLQHRPDDAERNAKSGVMLQLSGHTHGGQIIGPNILTKIANNGYLSGVYQVGKMKLYVSNGIGLWNGLAIRLGVPAEITQIILKNKD